MLLSNHTLQRLYQAGIDAAVYTGDETQLARDKILADVCQPTPHYGKRGQPTHVLIASRVALEGLNLVSITVTICVVSLALNTWAAGRLMEHSTCSGGAPICSN